MNESDVKLLWKTQPAVGSVSLDELRHDAERFQRRIGWRNGREYLAVALLVGWAAYDGWHAPSALFVAASALVIGGALFVAWQLHRRGSQLPATPETLGLTSVAFHRQALARQRDALLSAWLWYVMPLVPGGIATRIAIESMPGREMPWWGDPLIDGTLVLFAVGVAWLNRSGARALQRQIDALASLDASAR